MKLFLLRIRAQFGRIWRLAAIMVFYFVPATHYSLRWWWKEFFGKGEGS